MYFQHFHCKGRILTREQKLLYWKRHIESYEELIKLGMNLNCGLTGLSLHEERSFGGGQSIAENYYRLEDS